MAFTYDQLTQAIQDYCENDEATFVANIPIFIRNVEDLVLYTLDLDFFRKNAIGSMTIANRYLVKPSDYLASHGLAITVGGKQEFLMMKDVGYVLELNGSSGQPKAYANFDVLNFVLGPTPDSSYVCELDYLYRPTSLVDSGGSGTTWLSTNAQMPLLYGCLADAYTFMKGEADVLTEYKTRFVESLSRLKDYAEARENTDSNRVGLPLKART